MKNNYEFLVRIPFPLADELNQVSLDANINKTKLFRIGITRVLNDIKKYGVDNTIKEISRQ